MNGDISKQYLLWFDNQMVGRQVLLLMDGFSAHHAGLNVIQADEALALRHTRVEFLPENCTSLYQPLDQGIINSVKVHYKKQWLQYMLDKSMDGHDPVNTITLLHAVHWIHSAWDQTRLETIIVNCWRKTGLFGNVFGPEKRPEDWDEATELLRRVAQVGQIRDTMSIDDFLCPEDEDFCALTSDEMLDSIAESYSQILDEETSSQDEEELEQPISVNEACQFLEKVILFEMHRGENVQFVGEMQKYLRTLKWERWKDLDAAKVQTQLHRYPTGYKKIRCVSI